MGYLVGKDAAKLETMVSTSEACRNNELGPLFTKRNLVCPKTEYRHPCRQNLSTTWLGQDEGLVPVRDVLQDG